MAELDPYMGDSMYVSIDGVEYQCYTGMTGPGTPDMITIPATRGRGPIDVPRRYIKESYSFPCQDETGNAKYLALKALMDARTLVTCIIGPEGNAAGNLAITGDAYIAVSGLTVAPGEPGTFQLTISFSGAPSYGPNLVLDVYDFGSVAAGGAASGYVDPVASGGTGTETITMEDEDGVASALPEGVTWSGSAFAGTVDAGANVGKYRPMVKVVDTGGTAATRYFVGKMGVTA